MTSWCLPPPWTLNSIGSTTNLQQLDILVPSGCVDPHSYCEALPQREMCCPIMIRCGWHWYGPLTQKFSPHSTLQTILVRFLDCSLCVRPCNFFGSTLSSLSWISVASRPCWALLVLIPQTFKSMTFWCLPLMLTLTFIGSTHLQQHDILVQPPCMDPHFQCESLRQKRI